MQFDFSGKRILVTGGTRGIGRATVEKFLDAGAAVALNGRSSDSTTAAIAEQRSPDKLLAAPGDIATAAGCDAVDAELAVTLRLGQGGHDIGGFDIHLRIAARD